MKLHKWLLSVAAAGMLSAPTVSQAALIEFWDDTVETEWTNWLPNPGVDHFYDAVADEDWGTMVALRGTEIVRVKLSEATAKLKTVPLERYAEAEVFFG